MQYTNAQILGAVLSRFAQPLITQLGGSRLSSIPAVSALENRLRSSGWVDAKWTLAAELAPFSDVIAQALAAPLVAGMLSGVPDESVPALAHGIVDKAMADGRLELFSGRVTLDKDDLDRLKRLLDANLPKTESYDVKEI